MDKEKGKNETWFQTAEQLREGQELNHVVLTTGKKKKQFRKGRLVWSTNPGIVSWRQNLFPDTSFRSSASLVNDILTYRITSITMADTKLGLNRGKLVIIHGATETR